MDNSVISTITDKIEIVRFVGDNVHSASEAAIEFYNRWLHGQIVRSAVKQVLQKIS